MSLAIRLAKHSDARLLWRLNNDPAVRAVSLHKESIPWEDHAQWFGARLHDPDSAIFIFEDDCGPVGTVRFDGIASQEFHATVSIVVEANSRGRGLGQRMLEEALEYLFGCFGDYTVDAMILDTNMASLGCFEAVGFEKVQKEDEWIRYRYSRQRSETEATQ